MAFAVLQFGIQRAFPMRAPRLLLLVIMVLFGLMSASGCRNQSGSGEMTRLRELINLHNRGIGHLENKEWQDSEAALSKLAEQLPQNVTVARNLAVGRVFAMVDRFTPYSESDNPAAFAEGLRLAGEAVDKFRGIAGTDDQRAVAELLAGKLAAFADAPSRPRNADALH